MSRLLKAARVVLGRFQPGPDGLAVLVEPGRRRGGSPAARRPLAAAVAPAGRRRGSPSAPCPSSSASANASSTPLIGPTGTAAARSTADPVRRGLAARSPRRAAARARRGARLARRWWRSARRRRARPGRAPRTGGRTAGRCRPRSRSAGRRPRRSRTGRCSGGGCRAACRATPPATHADAWLSSEVERRVHQRHLDVAAAARAGALEQRGLDAVGRDQPADQVDDGGADLQRRAVGLARDVHQPAHRLQQEVVAGQRAARLAGAERGHRARHQARVALLAATRRRRGPSPPSARGGRTRRARRRAARACARARGRPRRPGRARPSACCGWWSGSTSRRRRATAGPRRACRRRRRGARP